MANYQSECLLSRYLIFKGENGMKNFHLTKKNNAWELTQNGITIKSFKTKEEALPKLNRIVSNLGGGSVKIHKQTGPIQEERTYGLPDPAKTRG